MESHIQVSVYEHKYQKLSYFMISQMVYSFVNNNVHKPTLGAFFIGA